MAKQQINPAQSKTNVLGYNQIISDFATSSTSSVQVSGLTATVTIPAGARYVRIFAYARGLLNSTTGNYSMLSIWDGTVGTGTQLQEYQAQSVNAGNGSGGTATTVVQPSVGTKTYNVGLRAAGGGTATIQAQPVYPSFILVEVI